MKKYQLHYWLCFVMAFLFACKKDAHQPASKNSPLTDSTTLKTQFLGGTSLDVPMGGNAFVTTLASGGAETVTSNTLSNWTSPNSIFSAYFRLSNTGTLTVKMKAKVPSGNSKVKLTINGMAFTVSLSGSAYSTFNVGTVNISSPGYVKVNFQGVSKTGSYYADVSDLIISGTSVASNVAFANDSTNFYWSRRGPSVHLGYTAPANSQWFYNEVTVPVGQDPVGSYFMANGFNEGYFGMQVNSSTERRILFSVWNPTVGTTTSTRAGTGVVVQTFSGEGNGGQAYLDYNWVAGNTYKFLTEAVPDASGNTTFSSWFYAPEVGSWKFITSWLRPSTNTYLAGLYSFLENFNDTNGYLGRKGNFGNQWVMSSTGIWTELTSAYFDGDATANNQQRMDYAGGLASGKFYLQNGGFFANYVTLNQTFTRAATGTPPSINFSTLP
ncbi:DUF3472 domain-containing protein [Mucilaginibacter sp. OK098]|uniref:DUF3472 domain-containing protein n=1 Tax=Mucilaginibacter sp. OK098 TaxID=1855297 RepID=UPI00091BBB68|nr:DUF5077 domain-containing protein [Mucilaginibacter sp. OK098]SHN18838.1 protein of unknown function [Mucilaginibacter sp. OK098]